MTDIRCSGCGLTLDAIRKRDGSLRHACDGGPVIHAGDVVAAGRRVAQAHRDLERALRITPIGLAAIDEQIAAAADLQSIAGELVSALADCRRRRAS